MATKSIFCETIEELIQLSGSARERKLKRFYQDNLKALRSKFFFFQCEFLLKRGGHDRFVFVGLSVNLTSAWYDRKTKKVVYVPFYGGTLYNLYSRNSSRVVQTYNWGSLTYNDLNRLTFS